MDMVMQQEQNDINSQADTHSASIQVVIYVAPHCANCQYAYKIAEQIRTEFPQVGLRIVDLSAGNEEIPESVFATPTYLLNGRVWSLGNPSHQQVTEKLGALVD